MTDSIDMSSGRPARHLLGLTSALLVLLILNLTVFDDLRTDATIGVLETFTKPQHLSSIAAMLLVVVLVALRHLRRSRALRRRPREHGLPGHPGRFGPPPRRDVR